MAKKSKTRTAFEKAFAEARAAQKAKTGKGSGGVFTFNGEPYTTDYAEEAKSSPAPTKIPRPPKRPDDLKGIKVEAITVTKLDGSPVTKKKTEAEMSKLRSDAATQKDRSTVMQFAKELMTGRKGAAAQYKKGGTVMSRGNRGAVSGKKFSGTY